MTRNAETDARHTDTAMHRKALACPRAFIQNQANSTLRGRLRPDTPHDSMPQTRRGSIPDDYTAANTFLRRSRIAQTQTHREKREEMTSPDNMLTRNANCS